MRFGYIILLVGGLAACDAPSNHTPDPESTRSVAASGIAELDEIRWKWTADVEVSGAAVTQRLVYVGLSSGHLAALGTETGEEAWRVDVGAPVHGRPVVLESRVIAGTDAGLAAVGHDGNVQWKFETGAPVDVAPTIVDSVAYFGDRSGKVWAVDGVGGAEIWSASSAGPIVGEVAVAGGAVYAGSGDGHVYRLDPASGEPGWSWLAGSPVLGVAAGTNLIVTAGTRVVALAPRDGQVVWQFDVGADVTSPPTLSASKVFIGTGRGDIVGLNAADGKLDFRQQLANPVSGPIVATNAGLCVPTSNGVESVSTAGEAQWTFRTDGPVVDGVAPSAGGLIVTDVTGSVYALR